MTIEIDGMKLEDSKDWEIHNGKSDVILREEDEDG